MAFDGSGRIHALNAPAERLFERATAEVSGRPIGILFPTLDPSSAAPNAILRLDGCRQEGATFPVRLSLAKVGEDGRSMFLGRVDREPSEAPAGGAAPLADILREEFLMTLSHELRSPLQSILSWAQMLRAGPGSEAMTTRGLDAIERNIRRQVEVIDDVLELSQVASGSFRLELEPIRMSEVLEEAVSEISETARAQTIRLTRRVDAEERPVLADRHWLGRIVRALLASSLEFTTGGGSIDLDLRRMGTQMQLTVADDSPPVSEEPRHPHDAFRHGNPTATRLFDGLGVALVKVQRLVELHGGEVQAESAGFGRGARLVVSLPIEKTE